MREILFRGKANAITGCPYNNGKPDGEWVFGYVFSDLGAMKIRQFEPDRPECNDYEVDPETVGQYTGLTDKNGKKIFEGDIMAFTAYGFDYVGTVEFADGSFSIICEHTSPFLDQAVSKHGAYIIGNMHDNPELLKGAE